MTNKLSVLISRSKSENEILSTKLVEKSLNVIVIDMIEYEDLEFNVNDLLIYEYIILTSKHACKIIAQYKLSKNFLVVGKESANIIKLNNISANVLSFKNVAEIIYFIQALEKKKIVYLSGSIISQDIPDIDRRIIYKTLYVDKLQEIQLNKIKKIDYIMIFSQHNFEKLIYLFKTHDIIPYVEDAVFICISHNIAKNVAKMFDRVLYATEPNQEDMIKLITRI